MVVAVDALVEVDVGLSADVVAVVVLFLASEWDELAVTRVSRRACVLARV